MLQFASEKSEIKYPKFSKATTHKKDIKNLALKYLAVKKGLIRFTYIDTLYDSPITKYYKVFVVLKTVCMNPKVSISFGIHCDCALCFKCRLLVKTCTVH